MPRRRRWTIGKTRRFLYRLSSLLGLFSALRRGPQAVLRWWARRVALREAARAMRKAGL
jgi:hypothetical protein